MSTSENAATDVPSGSTRNTPDGLFAIEGQKRFLQTFLPVRDAVIHDLYTTPRDGLTVRRRRMRELCSVIQVVTGRRTEANVADHYQLYTHLTSAVWPGLNWGQYTHEIRQLSDPYLRLCLAVTNSIDICWQPALENTPHGALLVEVGSGVSNGLARVALLRPDTRLVSITLDPDQVEIGCRIADKLGYADRAEFRLGDLYNPETTRDLIGAADAVTAMGVVPHFPPARRADGYRRLADMLKPGAPLNIFDANLARPHPRRLTRLLAKLYGWYPTREEFLTAVNDADLSLIRLDEQTAENYLPMVADTRSTPQLRQDFDPITAWLWPKVLRYVVKMILQPQTQYYATMTRP